MPVNDVGGHKFQSPTPLLSKSGIFEIQFAQQFAMQLTCFAITPRRKKSQQEAAERTEG